MNWHSRWVLAASAAAVLAVAPYAGASQSFDNDRGDIAARISMQNTFQHNGADSINWVQWRNEVRFDIRYDIIQQGVGNEWGPIKQLRFNILYRARADPVYEIRSSYGGATTIAAISSSRKEGRRASCSSTSASAAP